MRILIPVTFILLIVTYSYAQSDYDFRQDERLNNYIQADSKLSGIVETELSGIKWILGTIAGAVIIGVVGYLFTIVAKRGRAVIFIGGLLFMLAMAVPVREAGCQDCQPHPCRVHGDCAAGCSCNDFYYTCQIP